MAQAILITVGLYVSVGMGCAAVALPWLCVLDPAARGAYAFRLLLVPGTVLLWPLFVARGVALLRRSRRSS